MKYIYLGKFVNTHGIKGEIRILSNFEYKSKVFLLGFNLYIGKDKICFKISSYRTHKNYDMVCFEGINDILEINKYKGNNVYVAAEDLNLDDGDYFDEDLIGLSAYNSEMLIGKIKDIINNNGYKLFVINDKYIPFNENFIESISLQEGKIVFKNVEELL